MYSVLSSKYCAHACSPQVGTSSEYINITGQNQLANWRPGRKHGFSENFHRDELLSRDSARPRSVQLRSIPLPSPERGFLTFFFLRFFCETQSARVSSAIRPTPALRTPSFPVQQPRKGQLLVTTTQDVSRQPRVRVRASEQCHKGSSGSYLDPQQQPPPEAVPSPPELRLHFLRRARRPDASSYAPYPRSSYRKRRIRGC